MTTPTLTPPDKTSSLHFPSLTGLRFYAALLVFISHLYLFNYLFGITEGSILYNAINKLGQLGVGLFFVLSGFVLYLSYPPSSQRSMKDFYLARLARIYPVFLLTTLMALPIDLWSLDRKTLIPSLFSHLGLVHCFHLSTCGTLNSPSWSISSEFVFYLLFPLLASLFTVRTERNILLMLLGFLAVLLPLKWLWPDNFYVSPIFPLTRIAEFLLGMTAAWFYFRHAASPVLTRQMTGRFGRVWPSFLVTSLFLIMALLQPLVLEPYPYLKSLYFLFYALPSVLIILLLALMDRHNQSLPFLVTPLAILGGEISYSFYLIHHLMMRYTLHFFRLVFHLDLRQAPAILLLGITTVIILMASLVSAYWLYHTIEIPWKKRILAWYRKPRFISSEKKTVAVTG